METISTVMNCLASNDIRLIRYTMCNGLIDKIIAELIKNIIETKKAHPNWEIKNIKPKGHGRFVVIYIDKQNHMRINHSIVIDDNNNVVSNKKDKNDKKSKKDRWLYEHSIMIDRDGKVVKKTKKLFKTVFGIYG
jgi:hypothetical protein